MPPKKNDKQAGGQKEAEAFGPPPIPAAVQKPMSMAEEKRRAKAAKLAAEEAAQNDPAERFATWSRNGMTRLERRVWNILGGPLNPWKFRPQVVMGPYTCDFLSRKVMLCIEADGPEHMKTKEEDRKRDAYFEKQGILTLRLTPADLVRYTPQKLYAVVEELSHVRHMVKVKPKKEAKK